MKENKAKSFKNIAFMFAMLIFVAVVASVTYVIVYNKLKPTMLLAPTNLELLEGNELSWDEVAHADSYSVQILNRTINHTVTIYVYDTMYTLNALQKIVYDISDEIETNSNYSIAVKANSNTIENSGYCNAYELQQVNPEEDINPYIPEE